MDISKTEFVLQELKAARWKPPLITDTINRILMGQVSSWEMSCGSHMISLPTSPQSYCLEWYKSMDQKRALLDAAIDTYDGNCITTVLLFIRKTLNHRKPLFSLPCHLHVAVYVYIAFTQPDFFSL